MYLKTFAVLLASILLSACGATKLTYVVSPEIQSVERLKQNVSLIYIAVQDQRTSISSGDKDSEFLANNIDDSETLKKSIIERLKKENIKIIADPLLADLALTFVIERLDTKLTSEILKAKLETVVHIRVKAQRKGNPLEKVFKTTRSQEVAIPVNNNDVTGIINKALSAQLSSIFEDPQLVQLAKKSPAETTEVFTIDPAN